MRLRILIGDLTSPAVDGLTSTLNITYNSSKIHAPAAVLDGDCRLKAEGADNLLTDATSGIVFDAVSWMKNASTTNLTCMGHAIKPGRIRWVIRPTQPTKSITLSFKNFDLSPRRMVDVLYLNPDCDSSNTNPFTQFFYDYGMTFGIPFTLNGENSREYPETEVPCPITLHTECMVLELDLERRFANQARFGGSHTDYTKDFKGFTASYTSSPVAKGRPSQDSSGSCQPDLSLAPPPKPSFVWSELCCTKEDGNQIFEGNFWGNLSLDVSVSQGDNVEDYKIIYRVDKYNAEGNTPLKSFTCSDEYFERVENWYPSEATLRDRELQRKAVWESAKDEPYPGNISSDEVASIGKLWFKQPSFVRIHGEPQVVLPSSIVLNAPQASMDRDLTSPAMFEHVMISAVTCKATKVGDFKYWTKSEVALMDQRFTRGPSLAVNLSLSNQPANLVNLMKGISNFTEQLSRSKPLIRMISSEIATILKVQDRQVVGVLNLIDAVNISIAEVLSSSSSRRSSYKTAIVAKPGRNSTTVYDPVTKVDPEQETDKLVFYNVNLTISILCKSVQEAAAFANQLSQPQARRQLLSGPIQVQVKMPESLKVGAGGPCLSHFHCTPTGLFCSSRKVCEPCRFCSIDRFDAVDGMCPH